MTDDAHGTAYNVVRPSGTERGIYNNNTNKKPRAFSGYGFDSEVDNLLVAAGLWVLQPRRRREIVERLKASDVPQSTVQKVIEYVRKEVADQRVGQAVLARLFTEDIRDLPEVLAGIARHRSAEETHVAAGTEHMPNMPLGTPSCACAGCCGWRASHG